MGCLFLAPGGWAADPAGAGKKSPIGPTKTTTEGSRNAKNKKSPAKASSTTATLSRGQATTGTESSAPVIKRRPLPNVPLSKWASPSLSFLHLSDIHVSPQEESSSTLAPEKEASFPVLQTLVGGPGVIHLPGYDISTTPTFGLVTGDITEFGYPGRTPQLVGSMLGDLHFPLLLSPGNHDQTWIPYSELWRKNYETVSSAGTYAVQRDGALFMSIGAPTPHDPSPSIGEEIIRFVEAKAREVGRSVPVFVFLHHPLDITEFSSRYETDRLLDALRPLNVAMILVGHGHTVASYDFSGYPGVQGGSTFRTPKQAKQHVAGYGVVDVRQGAVRWAYRPGGKGDATSSVLEVELPRAAKGPIFSVGAPADGTVLSAPARVAVGYRVEKLSGPAVAAGWSLDDETSGTFSVGTKAKDVTISGMIDLSTAAAGMHYLRVWVDEELKSDPYRGQRVDLVYPPAATGKGKRRHHRTVSVRVERPNSGTEGHALWRTALGSSVKAQPVVADGRLYVGTLDGRMVCVDTIAGRVLWDTPVGAEVLGAPAVVDGAIIFGTGNGQLKALDLTGRPLWSRVLSPEQRAVASPVVAGGKGTVYVGTDDGSVLAVPTGSGSGGDEWRNEEPGYGVEAAPVVAGDRLLVGAWDGNLWCLDRTSGKTLWKKPAPYNVGRSAAARYYSPADCPAVVLPDGRIAVADRGYLAGILSAEGDLMTTLSKDCPALSLSEDDKGLLLRQIGKPLVRYDSTTLKQDWVSTSVLGRFPNPPLEHDSRVYSVSNNGRLDVISGKDGRLLWTYRVTPKLSVFAPPAVDADGTVYAVGVDGQLTAIRPNDSVAKP